MPIIYAVVARGTTVLAEYDAAVQSGSKGVAITRILANLRSDFAPMHSECEGYLFWCVVEDKITYLCKADADFGQLMSVSFLEDIKARFGKLYGVRAQTALAYEMNDDFSRTLQKRMDYFSSTRAVRNEINDLLGKVIDRGEKLELLAEKVQDLNHKPLRFKQHSKSLGHTRRMKKIKFGCVITLILVVTLAILFGVCGLNFKSCSE
eukprot:c19251_g1_i2.p1 GENE.c19251_g1_i2~~c19251_g1_i2.p1  ORF type:complete len:207 (+),score=35.63 c19251_g1_i2:97-717(+)